MGNRTHDLCDTSAFVETVKPHQVASFISASKLGEMSQTCGKEQHDLQRYLLSPTANGFNAPSSFFSSKKRFKPQTIL